MDKNRIRKAIGRCIYGIARIIPDALYLKLLFRLKTGCTLNLEQPQNYNEKLQWLKVHEHYEQYTKLVDKYAVKRYVEGCIGAEYVIPVIDRWSAVGEIAFETLPNQFVLKCTHDSAGFEICLNKETFDQEAAKRKLKRCMRRNFYYAGREWPYKNVKPQIIAEKYMEDTVLGELRDYKFFTFGGVPKIVHIVSNRQNRDEETYGDFFDMDYNHLDLTMGHNNAPVPPEKPKNFEKMKEFAAKLSEGTRHLRVDFYEVDGKLYFGELTFYQDSGFADIQPPEWNDVLGSWISLN